MWLASDALEFTSHSYDGHMFDLEGKQVDFPPGRYRVDAVTDYVLQFLEGYSGQDSRFKFTSDQKRKPFFLFVSYIEPHHQNDHAHYEGPKGSKERFKNFTPPADLLGLPGDWKTEYPDYLGCCASLDENVGRIRHTLRRLGLQENTIILYTSDHGSHFRTRNSEYKRSCHEGCIRIPLVAFGGPFTGGKMISELVSLIDLPSTLLDLAGVPIPGFMHGHSVVPLVKQKGTNWTDHVFLQISESQVGRAIRTARWKYSVKAPGLDGNKFSKSPIYIEEYLYDLEQDPHERQNLVAESKYKSVRADLAVKLQSLMVAAGEIKPEILPVGRMPTINPFSVRYPLSFTEDGEAFMTVQLNPQNPAMEIPLSDMLSEVYELPLCIRVGNTKLWGTLIEKDETILLKNPAGIAEPFSPHLRTLANQTVSIILLLPGEEDRSNSPPFTPEYTLLIIHS